MPPNLCVWIGELLVMITWVASWLTSSVTGYIGPAEVSTASEPRRERVGSEPIGGLFGDRSGKGDV